MFRPSAKGSFGRYERRPGERRPIRGVWQWYLSSRPSLYWKSTMLEFAAPHTVGMSSDRLEQAKTAMQAFVDQGKTAGIATLIAQFECFGMLDLAAKKPLQRDSLYRIYSLTKPVTSIAALMLYDEGLFDLDDPVARWIPEFENFRVLPTTTKAGNQLGPLMKEITIRHLLTHTSGLGYGFFTEPVEAYYRDAQVLSPIITLQKPLAEMVQTLAGLPLIAQPGTVWHYSLAHDVLGYLIALISGQPFDVFLCERVFEPLGMSDTSFYVPPDKLERFGPLYSAPGENGLNVLDDVRISPFVRPDAVPSGGAGLVSSMPDYLRLMLLLANGGELDGVRLLKTTTVAAMTTNQLTGPAYPVRFENDPWAGMGYGLGVGVQVEDALPDGMPPGVFGWIGASGTLAWIFPRDDLIVLAMQQAFFNGEASSVMRGIAYRAIAR